MKLTEEVKIIFKNSEGGKEEMKKRKHDIIIAIDPDTNKSGVAILDVATRSLEVSTLSFPHLIKTLTEIKTMSSPDLQIIVVVEAGWLNAKSNFHTANARAGQRVAKNVGANHQTGKHIIEMAKYLGFETHEEKPLVKIWKGANKKITHEETTQILKHNKISNEMSRSNQEVRDAVLLSIVFANLPTKL